MRTHRPGETALILVDLQPDFLPGGALAVANGDAVLAPALTLIDRFSWVVATQDWHPPGHGSFASSHPGRRPGEQIELAGLPQVLWPDHCVQGSPGAELAPALAARRSELSAVFRKGTDANIDSYSGFFDNGRRRATGLDSWLAERGIRAVVIVGLALDYCVKFTALDALSLGLDTYLVRDATRAVELAPGDGERALAEIEAAGGRLCTSQALLAELAAPQVQVQAREVGS